MVWNITKEGVRTRMAVVNPEAYLSVSLRTRLLFTSLSLFAPTEIPTGECLQHDNPVCNKSHAG